MTDRAPTDVAMRVARRATETGATIAVAESLTGGLLTQALATCEGAGTWLRGGIIAYSSGVKRELLGVVGPVVSGASADMMAASVRGLLDADVVVAVTGEAGPEAQEDVPVGTVFVACASSAATRVEEHRLSGDPEQIVEATIAAALLLLEDVLAHRGRSA